MNKWTNEELKINIQRYTKFKYMHRDGKLFITIVQLDTASSWYAKVADSRSGHIWKSTNECINEWKNKSISLSLSQVNK